MESAYGHGAGDIFLAAAPFGLIALIAVCFIKEVPLRQHNGDPIAAEVERESTVAAGGGAAVVRPAIRAEGPMSVGAPDREEYGPGPVRCPSSAAPTDLGWSWWASTAPAPRVRAGSYAAGLARRQGAALVVVFVSSRAAYAGMMTGVVAGAVQQTHDELAAELRQECRRGAEELGLPVTFLCRRGDAYAELCKAADEFPRRPGGGGASEQAGHRLVGSVATRLVRAGRWPVVVVP